MNLPFRIKKKTLLFSFIVFPFFEPNGITGLYVIDRILFLWRIIAIIIGSFVIVSEIKKNKPLKKSIRKVIISNVFIVLLFALVLEITYAAVKCNSLSINTVWNLFNIFFISLFYYCMLCENEDCLIRITCNILVILISINFVFVVSNQMISIDEKKFFLGIQTSFTPYMLIALFMNMYDNRIRLKKAFTIKTVYILFVSYIQLVYQWVAAGILLISTFLIFVAILERFHRIRKMWRCECVLITTCAILFNFLVVFFNIQTYFSYLIEVILHKSLSLHDRTYIWETAFIRIKASPIWGYGNMYVKTIWYKEMLVHNQWLQMLLAGGIIGTVLFALMFLSISYKIDLIQDETIRILCMAILMVILLLFIVEVVYVMYVFWIMLAVVNSGVTSEKGDKGCFVYE